MGSHSIDGYQIAQNFTTNWPKTTVVTNHSIDELVTTTVHIMLVQVGTVTSKYERILKALSGRSNLNSNKEYRDDTKPNHESLGEIRRANGLIPLILPLAFMGIFLTIVMVCLIADAVRTKRGRRRKRTRAKSQRCPETEQALEEIGNEANMALVKKRQRAFAHKLKTHSATPCQDIGSNTGIGRCMCKLERCAHCLGFEATKIQWKDLVYQTDFPRFNKFYLKNASTQTWMPMHNKFRALPQSYHTDSCISEQIPNISRQFIVETDSIFDSEISSKPHFPSSESNYTDSKKSELLSSIRVSGGFYYPAASVQESKVPAERCEEEIFKLKKQKQKGLKKQEMCDAQLLSEDWI